MAVGRVGITTDPVERLSYWQSTYNSLKNWRIISTHSSKSEAQLKENFIAKNWRYEAHPGGDGPEYSTWYVYTFEHNGY